MRGAANKALVGFLYSATDHQSFATRLVACHLRPPRLGRMSRAVAGKLLHWLHQLTPSGPQRSQPPVSVTAITEVARSQLQKCHAKLTDSRPPALVFPSTTVIRLVNVAVSCGSRTKLTSSRRHLLVWCCHRDRASSVSCRIETRS